MRTKSSTKEGDVFLSTRSFKSSVLKSCYSVTRLMFVSERPDFVSFSKISFLSFSLIFKGIWFNVYKLSRYSSRDPSLRNRYDTAVLISSAASFAVRPEKSYQRFWCVSLRALFLLSPIFHIHSGRPSKMFSRVLPALN